MMHVVRIPGPLRSYTQGAAQVKASGDTLTALLAALDQAHPGMRFRIIDEQDRIRPHIRIFVNTQETPTLATALAAGDEVHLVCALSGG
jgi:molybdopterin converting factor small subunit